MRADAKAQLEAERPSMAVMSLKSGQMSIGGELVAGNEIDAVVLAVVAENTYYKDRYDPDVKAIPDCYAIGEGKNEELTPYDEAKAKQHDNCNDCPMFQFGSDPNGGRAPACKRRRKMVLVPANGSADSVLLSIPPTSVKNWSNYAREVVVTTGRSTAGVVTKIKVVPSAKNQFEVKFSKVSDVPEERLGQVYAMKAGALESLLEPYREIEEEEQPKGKKRKF
jgi:hypothetical protein